MPRRSVTDLAALDVPALLARLTAAEPDTPGLGEQLDIVGLLRGRPGLPGPDLDRILLQLQAGLRQGLLDAREHLDDLRRILDKLTAPPWFPAVILGATVADGREVAVVAHAGGVRVAGFADGIDPADCAVGDDLFLSRDLGVVMSKAGLPMCRASETAIFDRVLDKERLVVKQRDEAIVVRAAGSLDVAGLRPGDSVRWDRTLGLVFEKIERTRQSDLFLEETPTTGFDAIGGLDHQIARLQRSLRLHMLHADVVRQYGLRRTGSVLLYGPPGTGKTLLARGLAGWLGRASPSGRSRFMHIKPAQLHSMWFAQSEANYREAFRVARETAEADPDTPVVMFFDEIDAIGSARGHELSRVGDRVLTSFMTELDGLEARGNVLVVAATNRRDTLDPALLREGRLGDLVLEIPRPNMAAASAIFERHLPPDIPYAGSRDDNLERRRHAITSVVSRLYAPNGEGDVAALTFRDNTRRLIQARDVMSGASLAKMARVAIEHACQRHIDGAEPGVQIHDLLDALADEIETQVGALTQANCHGFLGGLPQDLAVVRVEPIRRVSRRAHQYVAAA